MSCQLSCTVFFGFDLKIFFGYTRPIRYGEYISVRMGSLDDSEIRTVIVSEYFDNASLFTLVSRINTNFNPSVN